MSTKVFLVAFVIFVGCSCSSQDVSYESLKVAASRGKSFKTPELKYPPDVNFPRGASAAPKTPHTNKKSQGKTKMSGLKKPRSYSRRDSLSPEEDQLRPQQQETSRPAEVLLGKDVPPELGQHVRLSKTTLQERPYLPDKGAGRITAVQKGGMSCMVQFEGDDEEYLFNIAAAQLQLGAGDLGMPSQQGCVKDSLDLTIVAGKSRRLVPFSKP